MTYGRASSSDRLVVHHCLLVGQVVEHVLRGCLLVVLHPLECGQREALAREHHEPDADADRHLDRLEHEPEREPRAVGDAVPAERQRDGRLEQPDVAGPEREDRRDVHQQEDERGRRERDVQRERRRHGPDGEELERPADGLEDDRVDRRSRRAEHGEALPGHREQSPRRSLAVGRRTIGAPGREDGDRQEAQPDEPDDHDPGDRPVRQLRRRHHVGDEQRDREEVEEPVREHRPEERRARSLAVRQMAPQHGDAGELAGAGGQHRVCEQPDAEGREDLAELRQRLRHRLPDCHVPGPGSGQDGEKVEQDPDDHPAPADEVERVVDGVPVGPAPPDREDREDERRKHEETARPRIPGERDDAVHAATTSRVGEAAAPATRS